MMLTMPNSCSRLHGLCCLQSVVRALTATEKGKRIPFFCGCWLLCTRA